MELRDALERATPLREEIAPDWADVVRRARRRRRVVPAVALAAALAAAVFAVVSLWPSSRGGVLQRALAAVGSNPVVHVVFRSETHEELVDLATGTTTPVYFETEEWYAHDAGLKAISRVGGRVQSESVVPAARVSRFERQTGAVLLDGYRDALAAGTATVVDDGTVAGHDVLWISFAPEQLPDVADGRTHAFAEEVAIDRATYEPVYVRFTRDGVPGPGTGEQIVSLETLPAGSVDFTPQPQRPQLVVLGVHVGADISNDLAAAGARILGSPPLVVPGRTPAAAREATIYGGTVHAAGIQLCYGNGCELRLDETTDASALLADVPVPDGSLLTTPGSTQGIVRRGRVYVRIDAADVPATARALQATNVSR